MVPSFCSQFVCLLVCLALFGNGIHLSNEILCRSLIDMYVSQTILGK